MRLRRCSRRGRPSGAAGQTRRRESRSRWSPPIRPGRFTSPTRATAPTATPWPGCSSWAATTSSASTTTTTPAARWTASGPRSRPCDAARSRPTTATTATTSASWPRWRATPCPRCCVASRRRSSASASTSTPIAARASWRSGSRSCSRGSTPTSRTALSGHGPRRTGTTRTESCCAPATARRPIAQPTSPISSTSSTGASTEPSTCSERITTAPATGTPPSHACSATPRSGSRCSSISSCT